MRPQPTSTLPTEAPLDRSPGSLPSGYARQAIRLERALGWVLWIGLAVVLYVLSV